MLESTLWALALSMSLTNSDICVGKYLCVCVCFCRVCMCVCYLCKRVFAHTSMCVFLTISACMCACMRMCTRALACMNTCTSLEHIHNEPHYPEGKRTGKLLGADNLRFTNLPRPPLANYLVTKRGCIPSLE